MRLEPYALFFVTFDSILSVLSASLTPPNVLMQFSGMRIETTRQRYTLYLV
jgi:hypothetical protein